MYYIKVSYCRTGYLDWARDSNLFYILHGLYQKLQIYTPKLLLARKEEFSLEEYGIDLIKKDDKIVVDNLKWNSKAKKSGFEIGDYISELKIENSDRPNKRIIYPIAIFLFIVFGYFNSRRKE